MHWNGCRFVGLCFLLVLMILSTLYCISLHQVTFDHLIGGMGLVRHGFRQGLGTERIAMTTRQSSTAGPNDTTGRGPDVKLILTAYMRGGSSFTGDLFNHHPQVFYFYEPLRSVDLLFGRNKQRAVFFNRRPMVAHAAREKKQVPLLAANVLNATLNCRFESMYLAPLSDSLNFHRSRTTRTFSQCAMRNPGVLGLYRCLHFLQEACDPAKVTAVKVVRLPMKQVLPFLQDDPKVKVIHLVRDPRGILRSRRNSGIARAYRQSNQAFCDYVTKDLKDSLRLKKRFPGRILSARYEDIAHSPLRFAARLLRFVGLRLGPELRRYVWNITSTGANFTASKWDTARPDSGRTAGAWRRDIDYPEVRAMNDECRGLYRLAGYLPLSSEEELRDLGVPHYEADYEKAPVGLWAA